VAKPSKIVAGLDPEATNIWLAALAGVVADKVRLAPTHTVFCRTPCSTDTYELVGGFTPGLAVEV